MKIKQTFVVAGITTAILLVSLWYGQHNGLLPVDASSEAIQIDKLFNAMIAIATGLFILVQGALIYSFFAFRRKDDDDTDAAPIEGNVLLEIVWTAIPAVIVLWLAIYSQEVYSNVNEGGFVGNHMAHGGHGHSTAIAEAAPSEPGTLLVNETSPLSEQTPLKVKVTGLQYAWIFNYPDTNITSGELHLPVNRPVELDIVANDVIHAFWVPEFRLKQDAIPGQTTHLSFTPSRLGDYPVICAELCGAYHGGMKTRTIVHSADDYQTWEQSQVVAAKSDKTTVATLPQMDSHDRLIAHSQHHHMPSHLSPQNS